MNHSPLPWKVLPPEYWTKQGGCQGIQDSNGQKIIITDTGVYPPDFIDAQFIVKACNYHQRLLEVFKKATDFMLKARKVK